MTGRDWIGAAFAAAALVSCTEISDNESTPLSIRFESFASPSVVVGDSLRDTTGVVVAPTVRVFNYQGEELPAPPVRFFSADRGITVDSVTGVITGDSLRTTPGRIVASVASLQAFQTIEVTLRPDNVSAVNGRDTLQYSRTDSTVNVSDQLTVKVIHGTPPADSAVKSYVVSFAVVSGGQPAFAELVDNARRASVVDTTDASGVAGRAVRIRPANLTVNEDSVIVNATVKYRGAPIAGSPVRLVLLVRPRT